jgi:hypothetical protein
MSELLKDNDLKEGQNQMILKEMIKEKVPEGIFFHRCSC